MFSPNQIYDYLRYHYHTGKKNVIVRNFDDGSINPLDLFKFQNNKNSPYINETHTNNTPIKFDGFIDMYDQEPIDIHASKVAFNNTPKDILNVYMKTPNIGKLSDIDFMTSLSASMHSPIICHSEENSDTISKLKEKSFIPVHYWVHGLLSKNWFSEFKLLSNNRNHTNSKRFGLYSRDCSGTRKYRLELLKELSKIHKNVHFKLTDTIPNIPELSVWDKSIENITSNSSAYINWVDHEMFDIQIVPETLFHENKTHLTEKILKPIVMYQPFIVVSGYKSLEYIRSYGFQTFETIWDESYDLEHDSSKRFNKILNLINDINSLSDDEYRKLIQRTYKIVEHNRNLFYSDKFDDSIIKELNDGLSNARKLQEESLHTNPGGNLFPMLSKLYESKDEIPQFHKDVIDGVMKYCEVHHPSVASDVISKFNRLF